MLKSVSFLFIAFCLLLTGCGGSDSSSSSAGRTRLRVVHASPDAPNVNVVVDNTTVLTNVAYGTFSNYLGTLPGNRTIKVNVTSSGANAITANTTIAIGTDYTVLAVGRLSAISALVLTDNNTAPVSGQIKLRVVHAASGVANVDVYVTAVGASLATASPTLANVPFKTASNYLSVPAGTYQVRVTATGSKTVAIDTGSVTLAGAKVYTAVAVGDTSVGKPLTALLLTDN